MDLKPDQRSQASVVSGNQLSTYAFGYRKLTGKDAGFMGGIYELKERGARNL